MQLSYHWTISLVTEDVLPREGPLLLGTECFTPPYVFGLRPTDNLRLFPMPPHRFKVSWIPPSVASLGLISLQFEPHARMVHFSLPGVTDASQQPATGFALTWLHHRFMVR